jgi:hypothetical protein
MSELFCTKCGKLHESQSEFCEYCGYSLKEAIQRFKEKEMSKKHEEKLPSLETTKEAKELQGMDFYHHLKKTEKQRRKRESSGAELYDMLSDTSEKTPLFGWLTGIPSKEKLERAKRRREKHPRRNLYLIIAFIVIGIILVSVVISIILNL